MSDRKQSQKRPSDRSDIEDEQSPTTCPTSPQKKTRSPSRSQSPCDSETSTASTSYNEPSPTVQVKIGQIGANIEPESETTSSEDVSEQCADPPESSKSDDTVSVDHEGQPHEESIHDALETCETGPTCCFLRDEPYNLQEELSRKTTYMWGQILSDAFDLSSREKNIPDSNVFLNNAAVMIRRGDAEDHKTTKLKIFLRSGATLAVAADYLERVERWHTKALSVYEQMDTLISKTTELIETAPSGSQENRIEILCWKFQAWILLRKYKALRNSTSMATFAETHHCFNTIVAALENMSETERPDTVPVLSNILIEMNTNFAQMDMVRMAFKTWEHADYLISKARDEGFFRALESSLGKTVNLLTAPKYFIRYVREFVFRIECFDHMI